MANLPSLERFQQPSTALIGPAASWLPGLFITCALHSTPRAALDLHLRFAHPLTYNSKAH